MTNSDNAIEVRNLTKEFRISRDGAKTLKDFLVRRHTRAQKHLVLKDISLDIRKGETVGLIGVNGSGKSTLLKLMTQIIYPTSGTVETAGRVTSLLELGAGFHPDFTGRENIYFNASIFGMTRKQIDGRVDKIIEFSELGDAIDDPIRTYSSGMYMRLAFSVAINVDADILLIDEILAVGDQHFQDKCYAKLLELKDSGKTIVIVSHALDQVRALCTRAVWIYKGTLRLDGDPAYVIEAYKKQSAIDHKEEKRVAHENGTEKYKGVVFIDSPADFSHVRKGGELRISGWRIADSDNFDFILSVNGKRLTDISPVERPDVLSVYEEEYAGYIEDRAPGFSAAFTPDMVGELSIEAQIVIDGKRIAGKQITVTVE
ncbi:MAG: ABC transporter ATP-binding protein [Lachnospiraceae bacterium]|nr:ABC transporter ATP-binding protein [Lachnospiraceae bacterium]